MEIIGVKILTSGFSNGFPYKFGEELKSYVIKRNKFVFLASEFNKNHEMNDKYCNKIISMFSKYDIYFENIRVIDSRIQTKTAQQLIQEADVLWLSGGDTVAQYNYMKSYGLIPFIKKRDGVTIGMSAGSINMSQTAICTVTCMHDKLEIYEAIGLVDITIEPHFNERDIAEEILQLSNQYTIYGMCDDSAIIFAEDKVTYLGDIYKIEKGNMEHL